MHIIFYFILFLFIFIYLFIFFFLGGGLFDCLGLFLWGYIESFCEVMQYIYPCSLILLSLDKMAVILQTILSDTFSWMKSFIFVSKSH